jgi:hypothetical protein
LVLVARSLARRQVEAKRAPHAGDGLVPRGRQRHPDLGRQRGDAVAGACWPLVLAHVESRPHGQASAAQAADGLMRLAEARGSPEQHPASSGVGSSLLQWVAPVGCTSGLHQWVAPVGCTSGWGGPNLRGWHIMHMHAYAYVCVCVSSSQVLGAKGREPRADRRRSSEPGCIGLRPGCIGLQA